MDFKITKSKSGWHTEELGDAQWVEKLIKAWTWCIHIRLSHHNPVSIIPHSNETDLSLKVYLSGRPWSHFSVSSSLKRYLESSSSALWILHLNYDFPSDLACPKMSFYRTVFILSIYLCHMGTEFRNLKYWECCLNNIKVFVHCRPILKICKCWFWISK